MSKIRIKDSQNLRNFLVRREDGSMTVLGLYIFMMMMLIGGLALDVANAIQARTQLQIAADTAGHAALLWRQSHTADEAKSKAVEIAQGNMPTGFYGEVLDPEDVVFGTWDRDTRTFTADANSTTAVWVSTRRLEEHSNALPTYLLKIVGLTSLNINTDSVWELFVPTCMLEGFVANGAIDIQSNNTYKSGFCIHSNSGVNLQNDNTFEEDSVVSMPNPVSDLDSPNDDIYEDGSNDGLSAALHPASYELNLEQRVDEIYAGVTDPTSEYYFDELLSTVAIPMNRNLPLDASNIIPGYIYTYECTGENQKIRVPAGETISGAVIITNCKIEFGQGAAVEDMVMVTTNTSDTSVDGAEGVRIGVDDSCAEGGGTKIVSYGGMNFPAELNLFGSQLMALGDVSFSASANGLEGASIISNGDISGTTHMTMAFCGTGWEGNYILDFFRMVI